MRTIVKLSQLASIGRKYGPQEEVAYIIRKGTASSDGLGKTKAPLVEIGPMGARLVYVGNMTVKERLEAGQLATNGDYIMSLPAGTTVFTSDIIRIKGELWTANTRFVAGQKITPSSNINQVLVCKVAGVSGTIEPDWPDPKAEADEVDDGDDLVWSNHGVCDDYQVIQLASPSTYGDFFTTKLAVDLRQDIDKKSA